jgi:hypothetical protein
LTHPHPGASTPHNNTIGWIVSPSVERLRPWEYYQEQQISQRMLSSSGHYDMPRRTNFSLEVGIEGPEYSAALKKVRKGLGC